MLKTFLYWLVLVSACLGSVTENACTATEQKQLFDALLRKEIFTQVPKCLTVPFEDQVDHSGLRRFPIHVAIQSGDSLCVVNNFLKVFKAMNEADFAANLLVKDARGWSVLEYAAAYQPTLLETLFRYLEAANIRPPDTDNQPVPPIFSNEVRNRILRIALRDPTKTTSVIKAIRDHYGCVSKTIELFSPDGEQESFGLLEANMNSFLESVLLAANPALRLEWLVKGEMVSILKKFLDVFCQLTRVRSDKAEETRKQKEFREKLKTAIGGPEFLAGLLQHAFQQRNVDVFMLLNKAFPEALPVMIKESGLNLLQLNLKEKIISAVILEAQSKKVGDAKPVDLKDLAKSLGEGNEISKETELVFKAMFEADVGALKHCANEVVDVDSGATVFEVAVAYRNRMPFKPVELEKFFQPSLTQLPRNRMIWKLFYQSKLGKVTFTAARRIWVLRILVKLTKETTSLLEYFAHYSRSIAYVQELKFLATEMIQSEEQDANDLFRILMVNCQHPPDLVRFFQYLCRLQMGTAWMSQENFVEFLEMLRVIDDKESLKSQAYFADFIELLHDAVWFNQDWSIDRALLEGFVAAYPEAELILHITK